jgi:hypothetical protein
MRAAFGILSSTEHPGALAQLVAALGPGRSVVIHHDVTKQPLPALHRPNVQFVADPLVTAWGGWSLCEATLRIARIALADRSWDYLQLLSASCLPIRPVADFERHLSRQHADANVDIACLRDDDVALMSHGWRAYAPHRSLRQRVMARWQRWYMGRQPGHVQRQGLGFRTRDDGAPALLPATLGLAGMRIVERAAGSGLAHPFDDRTPCHVGSTWFGASRSVWQHLADQPLDGALQRWCRGMTIPDEFYFQTLLGNGSFRLAPSNHYVGPFDGPHPVPFGVRDLPTLMSSERWFARKFPADPAAQVRRLMLARIATAPPAPRPMRIQPVHAG